MKTRLRTYKRSIVKPRASGIQTRLQRRSWQAQNTNEANEAIVPLSYHFSQISLTGAKPANSYLAAKKKNKVSPGNYNYAKIKGKSFTKDDVNSHLVDADDVRQGSLGDCYLLAGMAAVVRANPDAVGNLIKEQADGVYDVTIYVDTLGIDYKRIGLIKIPIPTVKKVPKVIRVTDTFPISSNGEAAFTKNGDVSPFGNELWLMLIEKAYAIHMGGYEKIEGINPGQAMEMITGNRSKYYKINRFSDKQIAAIIGHALKHKIPITAITEKLSNRKDGKEVPTQLGEEAEKKGIVGNHAYAPSKITDSSISLQNPWGSSNINGLSLSDFKKFFIEFQVNG